MVSNSTPSNIIGPMMENSLTKRYLSVKLRVPDEEQMQWALFSLTDSLGHLTKAEEIFFRVPNGQLKLRLAHPGKDFGELISSKSLSTKAKGPNFFEKRVSPISEATKLRHTLSLCLEELAVIRKNRRTFNFDSINFHLDNVEGLGPFLDIEIHPDGKSDEKIIEKAEELLKKLGMGNQSLIGHSYLEMFLKGLEKMEESDESAFSDESLP